LGPQFAIPTTARVSCYRTSYPERYFYAVKLTFTCVTFRERT